MDQDLVGVGEFNRSFKILQDLIVDGFKEVKARLDTTNGHTLSNATALAALDARVIVLEQRGSELAESVHEDVASLTREVAEVQAELQEVHEKGCGQFVKHVGIELPVGDDARTQWKWTNQHTKVAVAGGAGVGLGAGFGPLMGLVHHVLDKIWK